MRLVKALVDVNRIDRKDEVVTQKNSHSSNIEPVVRANYRTKKYQTTSYFDQPPSYEYPPTYEEAKIIQKYYKFTLVGQ